MKYIYLKKKKIQLKKFLLIYINICIYTCTRRYIKKKYVYLMIYVYIHVFNIYSSTYLLFKNNFYNSYRILDIAKLVFFKDVFKWGGGGFFFPLFMSLLPSYM